MAAKEEDGAGEDAGGGEGEEDDSVAVGALGGGWCSGSVVAALGATLGVGGGGEEEEEEGEEKVCGVGASRRQWWPSAVVGGTGEILGSFHFAQSDRRRGYGLSGTASGSEHRLLEEGEEGEEEEPEDAHAMPVPGGAVDEDLTVFHELGGVEAVERGEQGTDAEEEVDGVGVGDEEEEVGGGIGLEEDMLEGELLPGNGLSGEEDEAEDDGGGEPGHGAAGGRAAQAEPLFHDVGLVEHAAACDLHGGGGDDDDGSVEPEDGGDGGGEPLVDVGVVGVEVTGGLGDEEGADDGDEEHEIAGKGEEYGHAIAGEALARTAATLGAIVPVITFATAAGTFVDVGGRPAAVAYVVVVGPATLVAVCARGSDDSWHEEASRRGVALS